MAKQRTEINAFTKGIIGSPSETDIPQDAASYSVNIDPNAEDGALRGINEDTVFDNNDGFTSFAKSQQTIQILRSSSTADNGSSTYYYNNQFFDIELPDGNKVYVWFDVGSAGSDPVVAAELESEYITGYEVDLTTSNTIEQVRDAIYDALDASSTYVTKSKSSTDSIVITAVKNGQCSLIGINESSEVAKALITVGGAITDDNEFTLIDSVGTSQVFIFKDDVTTDDGTTDGDDKVIIGVSGASDNNTRATRIESAINAARDSGLIGVYASRTDATVQLTQDTSGQSGNTAASFASVVNITLDGGTTTVGTDNVFEGGINSLFSNSDTASAIALTVQTIGKGTIFPANDMTIINKGSADNSKNAYDIIGIDYDTNELFLLEDIYSSNDDTNQSRGSYELLSSGLSHNNESSFVVRNKSVHLGLGNESSSSTLWAGVIEKKQFDNNLEGYHVLPDSLDPLSESLAPADLDHIVSFPCTYDVEGRQRPFSIIQSYHATISSELGSNTLNYHINDSSGQMYTKGDGNSNDINKHGKENDTAPKLGWCFRITSNNNDTSDGKLLAAKKAFFDATATLRNGDVFQIVDQGTDASSDDAQLNYIGYASDSAEPTGRAGFPAFVYGMKDGGNKIYRVSTTPIADEQAFDTSNGSVSGSRWTSYDIKSIIGDSAISTMEICMTPMTGGITHTNDKYVTYGDGVVDAEHISKQYCRGLHQFLWIGDIDGNLHRINILDLDELHHDETFNGPRLDQSITFDYSNIAKAATTADSNNFSKWYAPCYKASKSRFYETAKSSWSNNSHVRQSVSSLYEGSDWAASESWSREPSGVKIVGICETMVVRDDFTLSDSTGNYTGDNSYVFELGGVAEGSSQTNHVSNPSTSSDTDCGGQWDGIAHKWNSTKDGGADYDLTKTSQVNMTEHGFDNGQVVTFYNPHEADYASSNDLDAKMLGNTIVNRVESEDIFRVGGDYDSRGDSTGDAGLYCAKVWILFAKQNASSKFKKWDLFLYNYYPTTVSSSGNALMYDRTPPYGELGIQKWSGSQILSSGSNYDYQDTNYKSQNGTWEIGFDKEIFALYDGANTSGWNKDYGSQDDVGNYVNFDHTWSSTTNEYFRRISVKRRDGTVVGRRNSGAHSTFSNLSMGDNGGWYGKDGHYRQVIPYAHSLHRVEPRDHVSTSKNMQSVSFAARVWGKFCIRGGWIFQTDTEISGNNQGSHWLGIGSKFKTFSDSKILFTVNENGAEIESQDTRLFGQKYRNSYFEGSSTNKASHYYFGGRFRDCRILGDANYSNYNGTLMVSSQVPNSNNSGGTYYQGQVGDYLFIDRKWMSGDPDPEQDIWLKRNKANFYLKSLGLGSCDTRVGNNFRPSEHWNDFNSMKLQNGVYGNNNGYSLPGNDSGDYSNNTDWDESVAMGSEAGFLVLTSKGTSDSLHGSYDWDIRRYAPAFSSLHYQSCRMREFSQPNGSWEKFRSSQTMGIQNTNIGDWSHYGPDGNRFYGDGDPFYIVNAAIDDGGDYKSSIEIYQPNIYGLYAPNSYTWDTWIRSEGWWAAGNNIQHHSDKDYTNVPKLISHFYCWPNDEFARASDGVTENIHEIFLHGQKTSSNSTNKLFFQTGSSTGYGEAYNLFYWNWDGAGSGQGYMPTGSIDTIPDNPTVEGESFIAISPGLTTSSSTEFPANENIRYKISLLYDGYQESPLTDFFWDYDMSSQAYKNMNITLKIEDPELFNSRVSHINLYRQVGTDTLYRLVKEIPLAEGWSIVDGMYVYDFVDSKRTGSYEAIVGISENVTNTSLNYSLSCKINDELFVANCFVDNDKIEGKDAKRYIFKSKAGNFSQFDITKDYLILDTIPTAIASFNGRVYAFDRNNIYKINPEGMFVEDTFNGVGCLSQQAIAVSEYGMCFSDSNNVYLHDGSQPVQIGNNITRINTLEGLKIGYQKAVVNTESINVKEKPKIMYDGKSMSFVVFLIGTCSQTCNNTVSRAFAYNLARKRWDYWVAPLTKQAIQGQDNDILISDSEFLYNYKNSTTMRSWEHRTKQLSLTQLGSNKRFHRIKTYGSPTMSTITSIADPLNDNIVVLVDGVPQNLTLENLRYDKSYAGAKLYTTLNTTATSFDIVGNAAGDAPIPGDGINKGKYPEIGSYLMIDDEIVKITARTNNTFTITRAQLGTTAAEHTGGETGGNVRLYYIAPSIKLPSNCKGKKIEIQLKAQNGIVDGIGIEYINKGNS